jgi:hypothetical protein
MENLTIMNLLYFFIHNDTNIILNKNIIKKYIYELDKNTFWLGGQIKMNHNDFINLELIEKVKKKYDERLLEYGSPCNSFEMMSIYESTMQLELIENMIVKYNELNAK